MKGESLTENDDYSRVMWQCRRGMLELDILLQDFVRQHYAELSGDEKQEFLGLLQQPDPELYELIMDNNGFREGLYASIIDKIRNSA